MMLDWQQFLGYDTKNTGNKRKKEINWTSSKFKLLFIKGHYQNNEIANHGMKENILKLYI